jgi:hypothetical protein
MATKAQIRTRARVRADQDNSTFPSDTQYDLLIDVAAKETWFDLIQAGWPINFATTDKTAAGTNPITLSISGTVAFIRGVFYKNGTTYTPLQRLNEGQRGNLMSATGQSAASHYAVYIDPTNGPPCAPRAPGRRSSAPDPRVPHVGRERTRAWGALTYGLW